MNQTTDRMEEIEYRPVGPFEPRFEEFSLKKKPVIRRVSSIFFENPITEYVVTCLLTSPRFISRDAGITRGQIGPGR
ncbi:hypothetical protein MTP99_013898 [Tenebrio molitor]|nr:hypothetical protein MTP99_013898 [Tenebrio molitor]